MVCVTTGDIFYLMVPSRCVWGPLHQKMPQLWQHELLWARNGSARWVSDSGVQDTGQREGTKGEPGPGVLPSIFLAAPLQPAATRVLQGQGKGNQMEE